MKGTHEEFIKLPGGGHAFITGVQDKCDHDDKGSAIYILDNGETLRHIDYLCPTDEETVKYIQKVIEEKGRRITGGTSSCSKCGKILSLKDLMGDAFWQ